MDESVQEHLKTTLDITSTLLLRAADYIETHGLSCGGHIDMQGHKCTAMVIVMLAYDSNQIKHIDPATRRVARYLRQHGLTCLPYWSDSTPADQVVAVLRAVALGG
jgi:hypothetical protein